MGKIKRKKTGISKKKYTEKACNFQTGPGWMF